MTKENEIEVRVSTLTRQYYVGFGCCRSRQDYKTFAGALRAAKARALAKGGTVITTVDPMIEFLKNDGKTKIVTSLIGGKLVRIEVNTPACCDPSTETYWTM